MLCQWKHEEQSFYATDYDSKFYIKWFKIALYVLKQRLKIIMLIICEIKT